MAMTAPGLCGQSSSQLTRNLERALEDAQLTGELKFSGRKFKELPKFTTKYDLSDTVSADLSRNKLPELPPEVCELHLLERLDCYHNNIRTIPDCVVGLQALTYLNLSRNSLSVIPVALCQLPLQVLILANNKLVSLPEEISHLGQHLQDLDVSCNELSLLPPQVGELRNLRQLNVRRNQLVELPVEVCELRLVRLDISANRISVLPPLLRLMTSLEELMLHHNPLTTPPAFLANRGKTHVFKFLEIQAKKQGIFLDPGGELRRSSRKLLADLRYPPNGLSSTALGSADRRRCTLDSGYSTSGECGGDKRISQDLQDVGSDAEDQRKLALRAAEQTKEQRRERERRFPPPDTRPQMPPPPPPPDTRPPTLEHSPSPTNPPRVEEGRTFPPAQTYREFKEALRLQRLAENNNIYRRANGDKSPASPVPLGRLQENGADPAAAGMHPEEEFRVRHQALMTQQRQEAAQLQRRLETRGPQPRRHTPCPPLSNGDGSPSHNGFNHNSKPLSPSKVSHLTMRREIDKAREEQELIRHLREIIEGRLKVTLPDDLGSALLDGVVLCHLANNICPHSVSSIHVPSPSVPKLTMAKCRKNVENFLDACRRIGVPSTEVFEWPQVDQPVRVATTVAALAACNRLAPHRTLSDVLLCSFLLGVLVATCVLLCFLP